MADCITSVLLTLLIETPFSKLRVRAEAFGNVSGLLDDVWYMTHNGQCFDAANYACSQHVGASMLLDSMPVNSVVLYNYDVGLILADEEFDLERGLLDVVCIDLSVTYDVEARECSPPCRVSRIEAQCGVDVTYLGQLL